MKNAIFLLVMILTFSFNSFSQVEKNTWMIGGSAGFNNYHNKASGTNSSLLQINPQLGFFFADNFAVGAVFGINNFGSVKSWSASPFVRYYLKYLFPELSYGLKRETIGDISDNSSVLKGSIGYAVFLNDNVALEPSLYYSQNFAGGKTYGSNYGIQLGLQIYLNR